MTQSRRSFLKFLPAVALAPVAVAKAVGEIGKKTVKHKWIPRKEQVKFFTNSEKAEILFGSARGSGKTYIHNKYMEALRNGEMKNPREWLEGNWDIENKIGDRLMSRNGLTEWDGEKWNYA
ncbi:MAG: hypothetical protein KAS32_20355 [Candidatus Peribacteraceae bacterium]|nr:hypothetical protein [Candidatus Peribacteraceae bacterium]